MADTNPPKLLIVEARFYDHLADGLLAGAKAALDEAGASYDIVTVPGALEIPAAIAFAAEAGENGGVVYDGYVALGCVIRGETYHFDVVANESARGIMDLSTMLGLAIGNGILTVENEAQALARIARTEDGKEGGKGYAAAKVALIMIALKKRFGA